MSFRPATSGAVVDNKYRLAERIGGGGMGDVFRAETLTGGRAVAIKLLHAELAQNREVAQRFFQEAQAVNRIRHPNVVEVLDAGVGDFGPYIVMEYLDGESVGSVLNRVARFDVDSAVATAIPVLEALEAAHRVGIVHRDLKPENVFVAHDTARSGVLVRLLDFGIAKVLDAEGPAPRTRTGVVFGTPDYLSPEQATGEGPLDGRSDLFAVGVLLYELVTGMRPFRAPTAVATAFKVVHAEAPSIAGAGVHVDKRLEAVVHRLLQKEPARRFPAALEVIRELEKLCPDPARRANALLRLLGPRRIPVPTSLDARAPVSSEPAREIGTTKRLSPDFAEQPTQPSRVVPARAESSKTPRAPGPTIRASDPAITGPETPRTMRNSATLTLGAQGAANPAPPRPPPMEGQVPTLRTPSISRDSAPGSQPQVRPFPARHLGRFQVRGPVLRAIDKAILEMYGPAARDEIVGKLPERYGAEFMQGAINALVAYDLEALDAYMELASTTWVRDSGKWREIGRMSVDGELQSVVRTLLRPAPEAASVLRRGVSTWARLFSFGTWRVGTSSNLKVALTIGELDAVSLSLRLWLVGVVEQTVRRAVKDDLRMVITGGEQDFAPEMVCEIS